MRGFSFIETLIALVLLISISLALLKQHWQASKFVNFTTTRFTLLHQLNNASEMLLANQSVTLSKPFILDCILTPPYYQLRIKLDGDNQELTRMLALRP